MSKSPTGWAQKVYASWTFYRDNFKLSIRLALISALLVSIGLYLSEPITLDMIGGLAISAGVGVGIASLFNVLYESITRSSFRKMLADINPNIQSGVIVHESHHEIIKRRDALKKYLDQKDVVRIITSTADNYVKVGEEEREELIRKVTNEKCKIRILLYFPVQEQREGVLVGQRRRTPQELMYEHQALMGDYESFVTEGKGKIKIRFFTLPLHTNFIMIGQKRMFSAPVLHSVAGRELPCYEIYPTSDRSLFYKFMNDFDYLWGHDKAGVTLAFSDVKRIYTNARYQYDQVREGFVELLNTASKDTK